ncbi:MAG TPA: lysylphosphatidylglycerol synthase transmembrane domain-containing protein [Candidatus Woesebacteria bacterium]|jgi:hypothetical protein|nr:flippase-like domain-containing protein [Candidatus Shapirobacteria bacterium]HOR01655.1 lysylphosphatidylglycerol synthase transmembrane domain-containing protein [Candidatus Woesebacteria bacterium]
MFKKIINSKLVKLSVSLVLIYFAFKKVDVAVLARDLSKIEWWFLVANIVISLILSCLVSWRWSLLLIKKPRFKEVLLFFKSSLSASFYGLFLPSSAVAGDALKWIIIDEKYPEIPKSKLLGSILLDRFVGLTVFVVLGSVMIFLAGTRGIEIPLILQIVFVGLLVGCVVFYVIVIFFDIKKILKFKWLNKFSGVLDLVDRGNLGQIAKSLGVSLISDIFWVLQMWFIGWYFGTGLSFALILIFLPVISTILTLPISFAGFGAREQLFLYFFAAEAGSVESVLLMSTFAGILGVINSLVGGLVTLTPDFKRSREK